MDKIEYRVRPVTRYIVTRYEEKDGGRSGASSPQGEYENADMAFEVGYALCKAEHDRLGWPPGDMRILYPKRIEEDAQIKHMVDRFLTWRLPENFNPDGGISFKRAYNEHTPRPMKHEPVGTNLFDAQQAEAMVRHMTKGLPLAT